MIAFKAVSGLQEMIIRHSANTTSPIAQSTSMDAPIRLILVGNTLICYDKDIKAFRDVYGKMYELLDTLKDNRNIHDRIDKLKKTYPITEIVFDCKVGRKFGWRFFNEEQKARIREGVRIYRTGRKWDSETKAKIARSRKGKGNHNTRHESILVL